MGEALDKLHAGFPDVPMRPPGFVPSHYLELHIEQGPILEAQARAIGIVTGIQGKKAFEVTIEGSEGHAGTLAMAERRDAIATFARIASALNVEVGEHDDIVKSPSAACGSNPTRPPWCLRA